MPGVAAGAHNAMHSGSDSFLTSGITSDSMEKIILGADKARRFVKRRTNGKTVKTVWRGGWGDIQQMRFLRDEQDISRN